MVPIYLKNQSYRSFKVSIHLAHNNNNNNNSNEQATHSPNLRTESMVPQLEESMSVRDVCREVALQTKCKRPHCYSLYMMHSHLGTRTSECMARRLVGYSLSNISVTAQAVVLQPDQHLYELYKELHLIPGFKLSFSAKPVRIVLCRGQFDRTPLL